MAKVQKFIPVQKKFDRVVLLVDMDCFYCQVEEKLNPSFAGKPLAVVQYNSWRGGGIIAVNYAARAQGVTRHMRGAEAKKQCPDIELVQVPSIREKADISKYREAGLNVANILQRYTLLLERASVDEAYLDISEAVKRRIEEIDSGKYVLQPEDFQATYAVGYDSIGDYIKEILAAISDPNRNNDFASSDKESIAMKKSDIRLLVGASIAGEIRAAVKKDTGYECSAGIAHNKILAKLACGLNKPNKQTIIPLTQITDFFKTLPVGKIKGLGGKFGEEVCEKAGVRFLGELTKFTKGELQRMFDEKNGSWLFDIARGIDLEIVTRRVYSKSIGSCKKFPGPTKITSLDKLEYWLKEMANELSLRLEKDLIENKRRAQKMVVSYVQDYDGMEILNSRSAPLNSCAKETLAKTSLEIIKMNTKQFLRQGSISVLNNAVKFLGINVGKFEAVNNEQTNLQEMFANQVMRQKLEKTNSQDNNKSQIVENFTGNSENLKMKSLHSSEVPHETEDVFFSSENERNLQSNGLFDGDFASSDRDELNHRKPIKNFLLEDRSTKQKCDKNTEAENRITAPAEGSFFLKALKKRNLNKLSIDLDENKESLKSTHAKDQYRSQNTQHRPLNTQSVLNEESAIEEETLDKIDNETTPSRNEAPLNGTENKEVENLNEAEINLNNSIECDSYSKRKADDQAFMGHQILPKRNRCDTESSSNEAYFSTTLSYQTEYAEYAVPELRSDQLQFVLCSLCQRRILADERSQQLHRDHHLAQELSQQQRLEFQQQIKMRAEASKLLAHSKKPKPLALNNSADISKFLKKIEVSENNSLCLGEKNMPAMTADKEQHRTCPECGTSVPNALIDEHIDYHIAKYVHRKINQLEVRTVIIPRNTDKAKCQKNTTKNGSRNSGTAVKPITHFFKKPVQ